MPKRSRRRVAALSTPETEILATLSPKQKQLLAEILGNIAVAWFI